MSDVKKHSQAAPYVESSNRRHQRGQLSQRFPNGDWRLLVFYEARLLYKVRENSFLMTTHQHNIGYGNAIKIQRK